MPLVDGDFKSLAELLKTAELIVDECLEGTHVNDFEAPSLAIGRHKARQERDECRLGLARRSRGGNDQVPVATQKQRNRTLLNVAEFAPASPPDPLLDRLRQQLETS